MSFFLIFPLIYLSPATAAAARTARTAPAALPSAQLAKLAAHYKKHNDRQRSNNDNICHLLLPFHPSVI